MYAHMHVLYVCMYDNTHNAAMEILLILKSKPKSTTGIHSIENSALWPAPSYPFSSECAFRHGPTGAVCLKVW